jgi:energy-converting hydrogenase Eha subunit E
VSRAHLSARVLRAIVAAQGIYFVVTGLWPLVSMRTFELVTGPKTDDWLVKTVGVLVVAIGASLVVCARRNAVSTEAAVLGLGSAASLAAIDILYTLDGTIRPVYLADAALEILFAATWLVGWRNFRESERKRSDG